MLWNIFDIQCLYYLLWIYIETNCSFTFSLKLPFEGICVEFERQTNTSLFFLLSNCPLVQYYAWPVIHYFWRFGYVITRLYGRVQCLDIPHGQYFISTLWQWSTDECVFMFIFLLILSKNKHTYTNLFCSSSPLNYFPQCCSSVKRYTIDISQLTSCDTPFSHTRRKTSTINDILLEEWISRESFKYSSIASHRYCCQEPLKLSYLRHTLFCLGL